jgi:cytochrome c oxidase subunit 3
VPESKPDLPPPPPEEAGLFFSIYFMVTGVHALHLAVGIAVLLWLLSKAWRGQFHGRHYTPLEIGGMYWHVVDAIWILIFSLLYLVR